MFKMKKFKVVVLQTIVYEVDVNADSKEEAENKVKDIDVNTNILDQTDNFDFLAAYQAYECDNDEGIMDDEDEFDDEECQPD